MKINWNFPAVFSNKNKIIIVSFFAIVTITLSLIKALEPAKPNKSVHLWYEYTKVNNYIIFKQSFLHLKNETNLYRAYEPEHWDKYKYSPTFAVLFAPIAMLPNAVGVCIWNLLNVLIFVFALMKLPQISAKKIFLILAICALEINTAIINCQSNVLIAGLLIWAFILLEKNKKLLAFLCIAITCFIKIYTILFFIVFLFYPINWKEIIGYFLIFISLFFLPIIFISVKQLFWQYGNYYELIGSDAGAYLKYCIYSWAHQWFGVPVAWRKIIFILGLIIQLFPILFLSKIRENFMYRIQYFGLWFIFIIIFNHMAESATFIIAIAGICLWFFYSDKQTIIAQVALVLALLFTVLGPTDIYPVSVRHFFETWQFKVFPCIVMWGLGMWRMVNVKRIMNSEE